MSRKTILLDFDGVIHDYHGWTGKEANGLPIDKSRAGVILLCRTWRVVIFSTRPAEEVTKWLKHYGFPELKVTNKKEPAHLIIDDRALTFRGVWNDEFLSQITSFTPHWAESPPLALPADHPEKQCPSEPESNLSGAD